MSNVNQDDAFNSLPEFSPGVHTAKMTRRKADGHADAGLVLAEEVVQGVWLGNLMPAEGSMCDPVALWAVKDNLNIIQSAWESGRVDIFDLHVLLRRLKNDFFELVKRGLATDPPPLPEAPTTTHAVDLTLAAAKDWLANPQKEQPVAKDKTARESPEFVTAADIERITGKSKNAIMSRLRRLRERYSGCFKKTKSPRRGEPTYLYRSSDVLPHFQSGKRVTQ